MRFKDWMISESSKGIVSLAYPAVVAKIFNRNLGKHAQLMAKWYRDYMWPKDEFPRNWWHQAHWSARGNITISDYTDLYDAATDEASYNKMLRQLGIELDGGSEFNSEEKRKRIEMLIEHDIMGSSFFNNSLVRKILSGEIRDLSPYKNLRFGDAQMSLEKKMMFSGMKTVKSYEDGYKWIDVGSKCSYIGREMRNCGRALSVYGDQDKTILVLFDGNEKPHILVTYLPNDRVITADEGVGSSEPKEKYHGYILDLASHLGAEYDIHHAKSNTLRGKYLLSRLGANFEKLPIEDTFYVYHVFEVGGRKFYTNGYTVVPAEDVDRVGAAIGDGSLVLSGVKKGRIPLNELIKLVMSRAHARNLEDFGVRYQSLESMPRAGA